MSAYANKIYEITVVKDGDVWTVAIPELDAQTQADSLDNVVRVAQSFIAHHVGVPRTSFIVQIKRLVE